MPKFFIPSECIKGDIAFVFGAEAHHILDVMRLKKSDQIQAFDGTGRLYQGKIVYIKNKQVKIKIERVWKHKEALDVKITIIQALPKKNRIDYIIEKCTELGVDTIVPTQTARTIVRLNRAKEGLRMQRWQRIARETAKQCGRTTIPEIKNLTSWPDVLSSLADFDLKLLASLGAQTKGIKDVLRTKNKTKQVALFIGPEGDFTPEEISQACAKGCICVCLGINVLKSDTAAVTALAMINYELRQ